jgi:hypothetical protein
MTRHVVKRDQETPKVPVDSKAALPGGASGQPSDPPQAVVIHGLGLDVQPQREEEVKEDVPVRKFKVIGVSPMGSVMYDGQRVQVHVGNVYRDNCTDIALLQKQGVILEEIVEPLKQTG